MQRLDKAKQVLKREIKRHRLSDTDAVGILMEIIDELTGMGSDDPSAGEDEIGQVSAIEPDLK